MLLDLFVPTAQLQSITRLGLVDAGFYKLIMSYKQRHLKL